MSKFYVGQRVRIVDAWAAPSLVGTLATIVGDDYPGGPWRILPDESHHEWGASDGNLAPLDDRPEAGSWDEICALTHGWRPGVVTCD